MLLLLSRFTSQSCDKVLSYFLKKTKSPEDAKDLVQTTYLKLWQYRASLSNDFLLDQHLFHIARTVFIDYLRKQNRKIRDRNTTYSLKMISLMFILQRNLTLRNVYKHL